MCVEDIVRWFLGNDLLLNQSAKTKVVLFGTKVQHEKITMASDIDVARTLVSFCDTVKLLGVTLDSTVTIAWHVSYVQL